MNKPRTPLSEILQLQQDLEICTRKMNIYKKFVENCANLDPYTLVRVSAVAVNTLSEGEKVKAL